MLGLALIGAIVVIVLIALGLERFINERKGK